MTCLGQANAKCLVQQASEAVQLTKGQEEAMLLTAGHGKQAVYHWKHHTRTQTQLREKRTYHKTLTRFYSHFILFFSYQILSCVLTTSL